MYEKQIIKNLSNIVNAVLVYALCESLINPTPTWSTRLQPRITLNDKPPFHTLSHPARASVSLPSIKTFLPRITFPLTLSPPHSNSPPPPSSSNPHQTLEYTS